MHAVVIADGPAEKGVACGLHQLLALHHSLTVVLVFARRQMLFEHRSVCLLDLEEEWIFGVSPLQQDDVAPGSNASDADHLDGPIHCGVPAQQYLQFVRHRLDILDERRLCRCP